MMRSPEKHISEQTMWIILELEDIEGDVEICIAIFRSSSVLEYSDLFSRFHMLREDDSFLGESAPSTAY